MLNFATGTVLLALCVFWPGIFPGVAPPPPPAPAPSAAERVAAETAAAEKSAAEKAAAAIGKFNEADVRQLANRLKIPLPPRRLAVIAPSSSVPTWLADYVGAWGVDQGWSDNGVHVIFIIEDVDETGSATVIYARGPPIHGSSNLNPAYIEVTAPVTRDGVSFLWEPVRFTFKLLPGNLMRGHKAVADQRVYYTITLHRIEMISEMLGHRHGCRTNACGYCGRRVIGV